jgi:hypothetical protein
MGCQGSAADLVRRDLDLATVGGQYERGPAVGGWKNLALDTTGKEAYAGALLANSWKIRRQNRLLPV